MYCLVFVCVYCGVVVAVLGIWRVFVCVVGVRCAFLCIV